MMNRESHQTDAIATATTKTSSRSSTSGEEGFVSGSSLSDMDTVDNLAQQLYELSVGSVFSVLDKPLTTGKTTFAQKVLSNPDGAASIQTPSAVDGSSTLMAAVGTRSSAAGSRATTIAFHSSAASISTSASSVASIPATQQQQLPGAWFYEIGPTSDDANSTDSPVAEHINNDDPSMYYFRCNGIAPAMERVLVPSSEHVAEIVGRQGCKIKALRAKLDVFIRSPPRGEDPVFVITGRPDDVMEARREIELAAEHFTQIRASRRHSQGGCPAPGHVTTYVRVPLRVVGLVVGPKGATVKRIQQNTQTYIQTPSREREPVFEVTGLPHNVESARREIEHHIFQRTGNMPITLDPSVSLQNFDSYGALSHINNGGASHRMTPSFPTFGCGAPNATAYRGNENVYHGGGNSYGSMNSVGYMRSGLGKTYSAAGSPPPYFNDVLATRGSSNSTVNNENVFTVGNWQPQESSANRYFHDFVLENSKTTTPTTTNNNNNNNNNSNAFGSSNHYLGTNANNSNYLSSLSSSVTSRDEGLGDSPSWYTKMNGDAYRLLSSIWSDPDATPSNGVDGRGLAPQLASA